MVLQIDLITQSYASIFQKILKDKWLGERLSSVRTDILEIFRLKA